MKSASGSGVVRSSWRAACLLVVLGACGDDGPPLFLSDVARMPAGSNCLVVEGEIAGLPVVGEGVLDLMLRNEYRASVRYRNLATAGSAGNEISVREVNLKVDPGEIGPASGTQAVVLERYAVAGVTLAASGGATPGEWGIVEVPVIPRELGEVFDTKMRMMVKSVDDPRLVVSATFTVDAELQDGRDVRSNTMTFPIELCWGCLVDRAATEPLPTPCAIGQEDPIAPETCPFVANHPAECPPEYDPTAPDVFVSDAPGTNDGGI